MIDFELCSLVTILILETLKILIEILKWSTFKGNSHESPINDITYKGNSHASPINDITYKGNSHGSPINDIT